MAEKTEYRVYNNTDYRDVPFVTTSRSAAERVWRRLRPGRDAGNAYFAGFESRCRECGDWQDETKPYTTCLCAH